MTDYVVTFAQPAPLLSMNDRLHFRTQARFARAWRTAAGWATLAADLGELPPCVITITLPVHGRRHRDPHNYFTTVKHVVDGLVDGGCWPDDTPEYVTTTEPTLELGAPMVVVRMVRR